MRALCDIGLALFIIGGALCAVAGFIGCLVQVLRGFEPPFAQPILATIFLGAGIMAAGIITSCIGLFGRKTPAK